MIIIGEVVSLNDPNGGERIKVRIRPNDNKILNDDNLPFAYPLLPKMFHVKPKLHETVFVILADDKDTYSQRFYIGPVISQQQFLNKQLFGAGSTSLLNNSHFKPSQNVYEKIKRVFSPFSSDNGNYEECSKLLPKDEDISINGRKNCDIIIKDNDILLRSGVKLLKNSNIEFNSKNPAFLKLNFYENSLTYINKQKVIENISSIATLYADKINLIGSNGDPYYGITDAEKLLDDEAMKNILDTAHQLPYGDVLCDFLMAFLNMFNNHTHNYNNLPIVHGPTYLTFVNKYGVNGKNLKELLLSKTVRIN